MADLDRALADAREGRQSHVSWRDYWRGHQDCGPDCECRQPLDRSFTSTPDHEDDWIERYDNIIACLEELMESKRATG